MKNDFYIKGWVPTLVLKQRPGGTRKWSIKLLLTFTSVQLRFVGRRFLEALQKRMRPSRNRTTMKLTRNQTRNRTNIWTKHRTRTRTKYRTKKKNRTENWIRISKVTDKNQTKTLAGTQTKNRTRSPFFLLLVQPEAYNPEASNFPLVCLEPCWGFRVYKLLLQLKILNVDKTASKWL